MTGYDRMIEVIVIDNGMSLKQAADMIGISETSFKLWAREKCAPKTTYILTEFCKAFDISADWLLFGLGEKKRGTYGRNEKAARHAE